MEQSNDNLKDLYDDIFKINDYFYETKEGQLILDGQYGSIDKYCDYGSSSEKGNCNNEYFKMTSSGVIYLLENLKKYGLENDKLAEYAILWLSYKLNEKPNDKLTDLNEFYTNYIETNKYYNNIKVNDLTYKEIINKKINLLNIKEISKFNDTFGMLLSLYYLVHLKKLDCKKCSQKAKDFAQYFQEPNNDSNNIENSSYNKLFTPQKISVEKSRKDGEQIPLQPPEGTSSSSSILNTVIPVLSAFAIPVFLGVAYKTIYKKKIKKSKEENESLIYDSKSSDKYRNHNND
ncbi:Plasmodium variant antigen protein Cir/Yir/Bir, putative [Plasmodium chabaudi adami]|uniref:Plasmodium variant antigen protein Cir/Yir/Bir, putative n=1 Tax=Plasmodium chabaudi adami TaxID=5826 RepID=A0A1D3L802_PLACE|nr:Plasmodium variant antigen protein Cir/Yir/Bir, putative [Plasmodium chabaudi adami]